MPHARPPSFASSIHAAIAMAAVLGLACGGGSDGPSEPPQPETIAAVSGSGQSGRAGLTLSAPFVAQVLGDDGDPAAGVGVSWSVTGGGGSVSTATSMTDANGQASATLTLGLTPGVNSASATSSGLGGSPVTFTATGVSGPPASVVMVSGDGQNGKTLEALSEALVVRVLDDLGVPVAGVSVDWTVTSGVGDLPATTTTNAAGEASAMFTPGGALGPATIEATVDGVAGPITFDANTTVWLVRMQSLQYRDWNNSNDHTIAAGDTIEWVNLDDTGSTGPHTSTSDSEPAGGTAFDSGQMTQNQRFRFVPGVTGTWTYFCEVHGIAMSGTLTAN